MFFPSGFTLTCCFAPHTVALWATQPPHHQLIFIRDALLRCHGFLLLSIYGLRDQQLLMVSGDRLPQDCLGKIACNCWNFIPVMIVLHFEV